MSSEEKKRGTPVEKKPNNDYMEIRIPKLGKGNNLILFLLLGIIIALSFATGAMYMRMKTLEEFGGAMAQTSASNANEAFVRYAKQLKLNEKDFASCLSNTKYSERINAQIKEGDALGVRATPTFFVNGVLIGGAYQFEDFKSVIDQQLSGNPSTNPQDYTATLQQGYENEQSRSFDPVPKNVSAGDAPTKGSGQVTIVEYSDFQCPYCQRAATTMDQVLNEYKGKVKLVYKHYPIPSLHPNATLAANASECAREQGKFWEYHDTLFNNLQQWSNLPQSTPQT